MTGTMRCASVAGLAGLCATLLAGQDEQRGEPPRFRVSVEVVRIDAVVTDRNGRIVTDLTANDFEVFQDGKPQEVTYAQFVPVATSAASAAPSAGGPPRPKAADAPVVTPPPVTRESIQRTLVIVIDDLGLSWESTSYTKQALYSFVDRELLPSDLVAVVRTGGMASSLQPFTTDKRILHTAIDALRWNGFSRSLVEAFEPLNKWLTFDDRHGMADLDDFKKVDALRSSMSTLGTLGAVNLAIRGVRDLPGRKALVFASEGFKVFDPEDTRVREALDRAVDQATRAGVVIYALDCRGLQTGGLAASDNYKSGPSAPGAFEGKVRSEAAARAGTLRDTQEGMAYLAEQTGGFAVLNTNGLARGFGRITDDIRDYYVIGYVPDEGTFVEPGKTPKYHKITMKVRRPGLRVRTRKEFLGVTDPVDSPVVKTPAHQLVEAAVSPFTATEIPLRATTLPAYSPEDGVFVRALLHIDAHALTFTDDTGSGKKTASADVLGMAFDQEGTEVAHLSTGFSVALTDAATENALHDGLAYSFRIPIPRPGPYQVRFVLRDQQSGRLGSTGEFVVVPDIPGGTFALSGIVLQAEEGRQALRSVRAGAPLTYSYEIYNASKQVRVVTSVWRDAGKVLTVPEETLTPPAGSESRFAAKGGLQLGKTLPSGSYMLQISAATVDPKREGGIRTAVQRIAFDVF